MFYVSHTLLKFNLYLCRYTLLVEKYLLISSSLNIRFTAKNTY